MCTAITLKVEEEDRVQLQVVIPNQEDRTEQPRVITYRQDNKNTKTKDSKWTMVIVVALVQ